ncbi:MAG: FAD/NAD(P)-binding protein [Candidatus Omnitrophica bacterium]|nr:FAD/NAD(P)-binding protein [Candidatus Omnitrophota bacterium]
MKNEYIPYPVEITDVKRESFDVQTFKIKFKEPRMQNSFKYKQGQFAELSVLGAGEAPISITSSPSRKGFLEFTIRDTGGVVTRAVSNLKKGDIFHIRGPYGNSFPYEEVKGKNLYFITGGIGLAPLRSLINLVMDNRDDFGHVKILYGAKTPDELCFKEELELWKKIPDTEVWLTVDKPCNGWGCTVGVVTELWKETHINPANAVAFVCGPPIMIKFAMDKLLESGFKEDDLYTTLERYMKCGLGKCGHCNIGEKFICVDGPVFPYKELKKYPHYENVF